MTGKKRWISGILAFVIIAVMLISAAFIIKEADHDCTGEDCPICAELTVCQNTLRQISYAVFTVAVAIVLTASLLHFVQRYERYEIHTTLVTLKVKLSD